MKIYFSETKRGFYFDSIKELYEESNNWPDDVVEISLEMYKTYQSQPPKGMMLGGEKGLPIWVDYQQTL